MSQVRQKVLLFGVWYTSIEALLINLLNTMFPLTAGAAYIRVFILISTLSTTF